MPSRSTVRPSLCAPGRVDGGGNGGAFRLLCRPFTRSRLRRRGILAPAGHPSRGAPWLPSQAVSALLESWSIGDVPIPSRIVLAPMAGVSVQAFRRQGRRFGAGLVCSEMVSSCGLAYGNERTLGYLRIAPDEHPMAVQIFGSEPDRMAEAARMVVAAGADIVDINMGCPV